MNVRKAFPYILLSMLLLLGALYLIYYNVIDDKRAGTASGDVANELVRLLDAAETVPPEAAELAPLAEEALLPDARMPARRARAARGDGESLPEGEDAEPEASPDEDAGTEAAGRTDGAQTEAPREMRALWAYGIPYLGILSIPDLGVTVPVRYNYDYEGLRYSPSRYHGSYTADDLVIAAHNYDSHFGRIYTLSEGAAVLLQDADGRTHSYTVSRVEILEPWQLGEMIDSEYDLTLYTCTLGGEHRVTVRCMRKTDAPR